MTSFKKITLAIACVQTNMFPFRAIARLQVLLEEKVDLLCEAHSACEAFPRNFFESGCSKD